jgi:hypothetical protein
LLKANELVENVPLPVVKNVSMEVQPTQRFYRAVMIP